MARTTITAGTLITAAQGNEFAQLSSDQPDNLLINGGFEIWQRGTSGLAGGTSATTGFMADRWQALRGSFAAGLTGSREAGTGPSRYALRLTRAAGNTSTTNISVYQTLETADCEPLASQQVTFSAWVRAGATFAGTFAMRILTGTGTDQNIYGGFTGSATPVSTAKTLTTSWQRLSVTATLGDIKEIAVGFLYNPSTGTAGASDYFEFTGAQLEISPVPTPFRHSSGSVAGELAACQRYFRRLGGVTGNILVMGGGSGTTTTSFHAPLMPPMRVAPTSVAYNAVQMRDATGATIAITGLALVNGSTTSTCIQATHAINDTAHRLYCLDTTSGTGYLDLNSEI
jgi:hypothetical protein